MNRIPVAKPLFCGREREYTLACIDSTELTHVGKFTQAFEEQFADYVGVKHAIAVCNGTAALHLALEALHFPSPASIIVPALTYVATANAVVHAGAVPVPVDVRADTWELDWEKVARHHDNQDIVGVIPVHLYGSPCRMSEYRNPSRWMMIEDAAEAHGATHEDYQVGSLGHIGVFSFYANKIITCGEGGMVVTNDDEIAYTARRLRGHAMHPTKRYFHTEVGWNYRMTNMQAAIGLAQLEQIDRFLWARYQINTEYRVQLGGQFEMQKMNEGYVPWMVSVLVPRGTDRDAVMQAMDAQGIETRPVFAPLNKMPMFSSYDRCPVAEDISKRGINLPTYVGLTAPDIKRVCDSLASAVERVAA